MFVLGEHKNICGRTRPAVSCDVTSQTWAVRLLDDMVLRSPWKMKSEIWSRVRILQSFGNAQRPFVGEHSHVPGVFGCDADPRSVSSLIRVEQQVWDFGRRRSAGPRRSTRAAGGDRTRFGAALTEVGEESIAMCCGASAAGCAPRSARVLLLNSMTWLLGQYTFVPVGPGQRYALGPDGVEDHRPANPAQRIGA